MPHGHSAQPDPAAQRGSERLKVSTTAEIFRDSQRHGFGPVIDISGVGVAFDSYTRLSVGSSYQIMIKGIGAFPITIVRAFGCFSYGARFDIERARQRDLERRLAEQGKPKQRPMANNST